MPVFNREAPIHYAHAQATTCRPRCGPKKRAAAIARTAEVVWMVRPPVSFLPSESWRRYILGVWLALSPSGSRSPS